jgi:hypothetical protein
VSAFSGRPVENARHASHRADTRASFRTPAVLQRQKIETLTAQVAAEAEHAEMLEIENARLNEVRIRSAFSIGNHYHHSRSTRMPTRASGRMSRMQALRASISDLKSAHVSAASAVGERDVPSPVEPTLLIHALLALAEPTERVSQPSPSTLAVLAWPFFLRLASQLMAKLLADSKQAESNQRDKVIPLRCRGARAQRTSWACALCDHCRQRVRSGQGELDGGNGDWKQ